MARRKGNPVASRYEAASKPVVCAHCPNDTLRYERRKEMKLGDVVTYIAKQLTRWCEFKK